MEQYNVVDYSNLLSQTSRVDGKEAAKEETGPADVESVSDAGEDVVPTTKPVESSRPITAVLAAAGQTLEDNQAEVVLQPLRLAFESKNIKLVEPALDCLHVSEFFFLI